MTTNHIYIDHTVQAIIQCDVIIKLKQTRSKPALEVNLQDNNCTSYVAV